jgi:hypothetical protein
MRDIIVDEVRRGRTRKRGGGLRRVELEEIDFAVELRPDELSPDQLPATPPVAICRSEVARLRPPSSCANDHDHMSFEERTEP